MTDYQEITEVPEPSLQKGFYYHYKHDPEGAFNNYAYEVIGVSRHTETNALSMLYRPLYENTYLDVDFSARPLEMAMDMVVVAGKAVPRFSKIEDPELIALLSVTRDEMYPSHT
ncbi:MAG: hypothetical protein JWL75_485 [Parcubacteria group bacterium]|nr:hypothetical protein [Parcubacteria group bacterium]